MKRFFGASFSSNSSIVPSESEQESPASEPQYLDYLPKFKIEKFHGNGTQDARRWLMDLKAEFSDHNLRIPVVPRLWVEAILRETDEEAAKWMLSTPHISKIIENYEQATAADCALLEKSLKEKFPVDIRSQSPDSRRKILAELSQLKAEPLQDYYKRAKEYLLLFKIGNKEKGKSHITLGEELILESLIDAFVAGLEDEELRLNSYSRGAALSGSLSEAYDIVLETNRQLGEMKK